MVSSVVKHSLVCSPSHARLPGCRTDRFLASSSNFLGVGPIGFWLPLANFPVPEIFVAGLGSYLSSVFPPLP